MLCLRKRDVLNFLFTQVNKTGWPNVQPHSLVKKKHVYEFGFGVFICIVLMDVAVIDFYY